MSKKRKHYPVIKAEPPVYYNEPNQEYHDRNALRLAYWLAVKTKKVAQIRAALGAWAYHLHIPRIRKSI